MTWWLGSLPCTYCPISPVTSSTSPMPSVFDGASKRESSFFTKASRPPIASTSPCGFCITCHVYWNAFPSVKSFALSAPCPSAYGSNGSRHFPFESLPRTRPIDESNTLRQFSDRLKKNSASAFRLLSSSPLPVPRFTISSAIIPAHQSSYAHSRVRETDSPLILSNG